MACKHREPWSGEGGADVMHGRIRTTVKGLLGLDCEY